MGRPVLTRNAEKLSAVWPEVSSRAVAALRRRGVAQDVAEDAVLEAVTRAIAGEVAYTDATDLLRWINVVARRVVVDAHRRDGRLVYAVPDSPAPDNPAGAVEARSQLNRVAELVASLSTADRDALLTRPESSGRREATRRAVRRHRVRARLLVLLEGAGAVLGWLQWRWTRRHTARAAVAATGVPLLVVALVSLLPVGDGPSARQGDAEPVIPEIVSAPASDGFLDGSLRRVPAAEEGASAPPGPSLPRLDLRHPGVEGQGELWGRPKEPGDHLVCAGLIAVGTTCAGLPIVVTG